MNAQQKQRNFMSNQKVKEDLEKFYDKPVTKVSLELVLSLVTVLLFAVFALRPTLNTMSQLTKEIEDKKVIETGLTRKLTALATAQNEYLTYRDRFDILEEAIHESPTLETALFYLEYLVNRENISLAGLRIESFPVGVVPVLQTDSDDDLIATTSAATRREPEKEIGLYAIQATFSGDYPNMLRFFQVMESIRPLFSVESFSFTVIPSRPNEPPTLRGSATIYMYGYQDEGTTGATTVRERTGN